MELTYGGITYKSLTEMAQKAPEDTVFGDTLKEKGGEILDRALDVFFNDQREVNDARTALNDMKDLEKAMKACIERTQNRHSENDRAAEARTVTINETKEGLRRAGEEKLDNAPRIAGRGMVLEKGNEIIQRGRRVTADETAAYKGAAGIEMEGVEHFIRDLHTLLPLYTCVAMVPGPMGLSVKNFARETMHKNVKDHKESSTEYESSKKALSILLLGGSKAGSTRRDSSVSDHEEQIIRDKITTDERVMPMLLDLKDRIDGLKIEQGTPGVITGIQSMREYATFQVEKKQSSWGGLFTTSQTVEEERLQHQIPVEHLKDYTGSAFVQSDVVLERVLEKPESVPSHIWIPAGTIADNNQRQV